MGWVDGRLEAGPHFVGRSRDLDALDAQWRMAAAGRPRVAVVDGPAGIGKTALVERWLATIPGSRAALVTGDDGEVHVPFGIVDRLVVQLDADRRPASVAPGTDSLLVGARLVHLLGAASAGGQPLVVVVDDAHWCDAPSFRALTFALRRLVAEPVLTILATRDVTIPTDAPTRLVEHGGGIRLTLEGLSARAVTELATRVRGEAVDRVVGHRLREYTEGNPLYVSALLRELDVTALRGTAGPLPAPRSFAQQVTARMRRCPEQTARLVAAAAVAGQVSPLRLAAQVAEVGDATEALQQAVDADLLRAEGSPPGEMVAFPHALVRAAVYHDLGPADRSRLHARTAELVDPAAALDHRIAATLVTDDELAEQVAALARDEVATGAVLPGAWHLVAAARLSADPERCEALVLDGVTHLLRAGQVGAAAGLLQERGVPSPSAGRGLVTGLLAFFSGDQAVAERELADAWRRAGADQPELAAEAASFLAQLCSIQVRAEDTIRWAGRALEASGDPRCAPAFSVLVCQLWFVGRRDEAIHLLGGLPAPGGGPPDADAELLLVRGLIRMWSDQREGACADLGASVATSRPLLASRSGLIALAYLAEAEFRRGAWDESIAHAAQAVSLTEATDQVWTGAFVHSMACMGLAGRGQWAQAQHHATQAVRSAVTLGDAASVGHAATAAAFLGHCRRRPDEVLAAIEPADRHPNRLVLEHPAVHYALDLVRAEALVAVGRLADARRRLDEYADRAAAWSVPICRGDVERVQGLLASADGDTVGATDAFECALDHLEGTCAPWERASTELAYGALLRRAGGRRAARERLQRARDLFAGLGAQPWVTRCDRELAATGLAPARRSHPDERLRLTPQELAVAHLVASGATNREVAEELVVSTKTVEYHLSGVFRKLGIVSRRELAARMPAGPDPDPGAVPGAKQA